MTHKGILGRLLIASLVLSSPALARKLSDKAALAGLHQAKAIFLVSSRQPVAVEHLMKLIALTGRQLRAQKVTPHFIVTFIGPNVAFLTHNRRGIPYTDERAVANIQKDIRTMSGTGIQFQACGVALHGMDVNPGTLIPQVTPVGNGFISVIAYQEKGYALVPVS